MRFWPKRRPRKAFSGITTTFAMMYPVLIQVISWKVAPSVPIMWGSATATIDESIAPMSVPNVIDTVTSHLFGLGRGTRSAGKADGIENEGAWLAMARSTVCSRRRGHARAIAIRARRADGRARIAIA